jgi:hypothetical protein
MSFYVLDRRSEVQYSEPKVYKHCAQIIWFHFFVNEILIC